MDWLAANWIWLVLGAGVLVFFCFRRRLWDGSSSAWGSAERRDRREISTRSPVSRFGERRQ